MKEEQRLKDNFGVIDEIRLTYDMICVKCNLPFTEQYPCRRCRTCFDMTILDSKYKPIIRKITKEVWYLIKEI